MARTPRAKPPKIEIEEPEIDKDDDLPEVIEDDTQTEVVANGADHSDAATQSVEELRAQLADERQRRERAEADARSARDNVNKAAEDLDASNIKVIENAIAKEEGTKRELRAKIKAAKESGDYDAEIEAEDLLQQANINIKTLSNGKNELDRRIEDKKNEPSDPVERYVKGMAPKAQTWIRAHPEYVQPDKLPDLEAAHFTALGKRLVMGTDAYFDFIEKELGLKGDDTPPVKVDDPQRQQQRQQQPPSAPVSRSNNSSTVKLPFGVEQLPSGAYRLSAARREAARISGLSDGDYLKNLLALEAEGRVTIN